jgi:hypothetical protein
MQRGEFRRFVRGDALAEVFFQHIAVLGDRRRHVAEDDALACSIPRTDAESAVRDRRLIGGNETLSSFNARMSKRCHSRSRLVGSGSFSNVRHAVSRWDFSQSGSPEVTASTVCCVNPVVIVKRCGDGATPPHGFSSAVAPLPD